LYEEITQLREEIEDIPDNNECELSICVNEDVSE